MSTPAIYNHRTLQSATGTGHAQAARFGDALEAVKHEYDLVASELVQARTLRDEYEAKVTSQINELNIIRHALYELEAQHGKVRQRYEDEIAHLRAEMHALRQLPAASGLHASSSAHAPTDSAYLNRDRDRVADRYVLADRERERDRDREREREIQRDRERDRERGGERDPKRLKIKAPDHFSPLLPPVQSGSQNGHHHSQSLPPLSESHPHPSSRGVPGPGIPLAMESPRPLRTAPSSLPQLPEHPHPHPPRAASRPPPPPDDRDRDRDRDMDTREPYPAFLENLDISTVPPEFKKDNSDWFAVWNPRIRPRAIGDVSLIHTLLHATVVCCVQFSADGRYVATGCNRTAQIFDVKTGNKTCVLVDDTSGSSGDLYIRSVRFSPDGRYLATGAEDRQVRIWDIAKKRIRSVFSGHTQEIYSLDFSRDGRRIVSGSGDRTARIWDMDTGACLVLPVDTDLPPNSSGGSTSTGTSGPGVSGNAEGGAVAPTAGGSTTTVPPTTDAGVTSVAMSPDGRFVAAGSLDTFVRIWDAYTGVLLDKLRGHRDSVYSVVFTPDGRGVVSGSLDKTMKWWDVSGLYTGGGKIKKEMKDEKGLLGVGQCTMNFTGHKDYVLSVAVSHDGQWIVSGSKDRGVQFWDRAGGVQCMLQGHKNSVISIDLNPTTNLLATGSGDNLARIWSYTTP
ncbi:chromatin associated protein [Favolaschia claudopus]|uniref:Chromatin associated protein n=1 Tax=Favolaschia claudopus TaxID=2862362 RepID=A0AAV9Z4D3_9AGAR